VSEPVSLFQMDAVDWLRGLPAGSADVIVTDPPYESLEKHRAIGTTTRLKQSKASSNPWFRIFPNARFGELFDEVFRVLARNAHFYLFTDPETAFVARPIAEAAGFKFWKPLIWDKQSIGMGYHYRSRYEMILFFEKGKRRLNDLAVPDILTAPRVRGGYPAEKPPRICEILIGQSTRPGDLVVDPFMGSASAGVAALNLGRRFWGNDICDESLALARARLMPSPEAQSTAQATPGGPRTPPLSLLKSGKPSCSG
jgi:site-specific DNA-methyltransferase (adenine-specific)